MDSVLSAQIKQRLKSSQIVSQSHTLSLVHTARCATAFLKIFLVLFSVFCSHGAMGVNAICYVYIGITIAQNKYEAHFMCNVALTSVTVISQLHHMNSLIEIAFTNIVLCERAFKININFAREPISSTNIK